MANSFEVTPDLQQWRYIEARIDTHKHPIITETYINTHTHTYIQSLTVINFKSFHLSQIITHLENYLIKINLRQ